MKNIKYMMRNFSTDDLNIINDIKNEFSLSYFNSRLLFSRGLKDKEIISKFLNSGINDLNDTSTMKDSNKFINHVINCILENRKIILATDYDCDGTCGGAVAYKCLKYAGANVDYFSNNRFEEGYGLSIASVNKILAIHPDVDTIITIDNGITSFDAIDFCNNKSITVLITDHHEPFDKLPSAKAIVNPKRKDCAYKFKGLCGAGVIFKLMLLLFKTLKINSDYVYDLIDIVALATVGDVVPLIDENRIIVKEGLKKINSSNASKAFYHLKMQFKKESGVTESFLSFTVVPLINACSRITGDCYESIEFLIQENDYFVRKHLNKLIELNDGRKKLTLTQCEKAKKVIYENENLFNSNAIVVYDSSFHEGIIGLIAAKLSEEFHKPSIVFAPHKQTNVLKGSGRSIGNIHLKDSLSKASDLLIGFGGHSGAAGMSIEESKVDQFRERLNNVINVSAITSSDVYYIDEVYDSISVETVNDILKLAPFGESFEKPRIGLRNFMCYKMDLLKESTIKIQSDKINILSFGVDRSFYNKISDCLTIKAVGTPEINNYKGKESINFITEFNSIVKSSTKPKENLL